MTPHPLGKNFPVSSTVGGDYEPSIMQISHDLYCDVPALSAALSALFKHPWPLGLALHPHRES